MHPTAAAEKHSLSPAALLADSRPTTKTSKPISIGLPASMASVSKPLLNDFASGLTVKFMGVGDVGLVTIPNEAPVKPKFTVSSILYSYQFGWLRDISLSKL